MINLDISNETKWIDKIPTLSTGQTNTPHTQNGDGTVNAGTYNYTIYDYEIPLGTNHTFICEISMTTYFAVGLYRNVNNTHQFASYNRYLINGSVESGNHTLIFTVDENHNVKQYFDGVLLRTTTITSTNTNRPYKPCFYSTNNGLNIRSISILDYCLTEHEIRGGGHNGIQ